MKWVDHLKTKWGITSNLDFFLIMVVFSLAGMMISVCRPVVFHVIGITPKTHLWVKIAAYIPLIPPIYQVFLLIFGALLGQFHFFWEKEKKLGRFLIRQFSKLTTVFRRA